MSKNIKRIFGIIICLTLVISTFTGIAVVNADSTKVKNVILLIPDGMSISHTALARWYKGGTPLAMDEIVSGLVRTYSSDAAIADSAPAGTAMATGYKSHTGYIGVLPDVANMPGQKSIIPGDGKKPVATVLEAANYIGKATGIVSTSRVQHATPAAFTSHYHDRNAYEIIAEQQVYNDVDVVLGAGSGYLDGSKRKDKEDLIGIIKGKGYDYVTTKDEMLNSEKNRIWGMFSSKDLPYDIDRDAAAIPSLEEMTLKAIDVLSKDKDGFFLMVEGSEIDWAAHANDPIGVIGDVLAFDKAVKAALDFAKKTAKQLS